MHFFFLKDYNLNSANIPYVQSNVFIIDKKREESNNVFILARTFKYDMRKHMFLYLEYEFLALIITELLYYIIYNKES